MENDRNLGRGGSASLTALASQIGVSRRGTNHGALEDAGLAMMIYLDQHACPYKFPLESLPSHTFNLKACPPQPDGPLPRRNASAPKRAPQIRAGLAARPRLSQHLDARRPASRTPRAPSTSRGTDRRSRLTITARLTTGRLCLAVNRNKLASADNLRRWVRR